MTSINIIGDIAGNYKELMLLLEKMPEADLIVSVGDMIDRGPNSKQVIDFFMNNPKACAVMGNHEHMMLDYYRPQFVYDRKKPHEADKVYGTNGWLYNGGGKTITSYDALPVGALSFPTTVLDWVETLPLVFRHSDEHGKLIITHAPICRDLRRSKKLLKGTWKFSDGCLNPRSVIWYRGMPERRSEYQVFGHNSGMYGLYRFSDEKGEYACCIDDSCKDKLTGFHWPSKEVFQQDILEKKNEQ